MIIWRPQGKGTTSAQMKLFKNLFGHNCKLFCKKEILIWFDCSVSNYKIIKQIIAICYTATTSNIEQESIYFYYHTTSSNLHLLIYFIFLRKTLRLADKFGSLFQYLAYNLKRIAENGKQKFRAKDKEGEGNNHRFRILIVNHLPFIV